MNAKIKKFLAFVCRIYWHDTPSKIIAIGTLINIASVFDRGPVGYCLMWLGSAMIYPAIGFVTIQSRRRMAKHRAADQAFAVANRHVEAMLTISPISTTVQIDSRFEQMEAAIDAHARAVNELAALYKPEGKK